MIRSFKDSRMERLFHGEEVREFQAFARQAEKRLHILDAADTRGPEGGPPRAVQHSDQSAMAGVL
jgi:plasmid maintenance system killer protein